MTEADFLAALAEQPNDETTRLVFADWLEEHADTRAVWLRDPVLYRFAGPRLDDPLLSVVPNLGKVRERAALTHAVKVIGPRAAAVLVPIFRTGNKTIREQVRALLKFCGPAAAELLPAFREEITSSDIDRRVGGIRSLGWLGPTVAASEVPLLIERLADRENRVFVAAVVALGNLGPATASAVPHLARALKRAWKIRSDDIPDWEEPQTVINLAAGAVLVAIERSGPAAVAAFECIYKTLDRDDRDFQTICKRILKGLGVGIVPRLLRQIPHHWDGYGSYHGIDIVCALGPAAYPHLRKGLTSRVASSRLGAVRVLWELTQRGKTDVPAELADTLPLVADCFDRASGDEVMPTAKLLGRYGSTSRAILERVRRRLEGAEPAHREVLRKLVDRLERPDDLAGRLASNRPGVRLLALDLLAGLDDPIAQEASYAQLLDDADEAVRLATIAAVVAVGKTLRWPLIELLARRLDDTAQTVRLAAIRALWETVCGREERCFLVPTLLAHTDEPDRETFDWIVLALLRFSPTPLPAEVEDRVFELLHSDDPDRIRRTMDCLELGESWPRFLPRLTQLLNHEDERIQQAALARLSCYPELPTTLEGRLLDCCEGESLRNSALAALERVAPRSEAVPVRLLRLAPRLSTYECSCVYVALGKLGNLNAAMVPALSDLLLRPECHSGEVTGLLLSLGQPGIAALRDVLQRADPHGLDGILSHLKEVGITDPGLANEVVRLLDHPIAEVADAALRAVGKAGPLVAHVVPRLVGMLRSDRSGWVQQALGNLGPVTVPHLGAIIAFWKSDDCPDAARYLWLFGALAPYDPRAVECLVSMLGGSPAKHAARLLGEAGPAAASAVPALLDALQSNQAEVQQHAAEALGKIGRATDEVEAALNRRLRSEEPVRRAARWALQRLFPERYSAGK